MNQSHNNTLYEKDFDRWAQQQAQLLREGRFSELDTHNLAEEIKDMGKHESRALTSHLMQLLMHLLKWHYQPKRQSRSWQDSIINHRFQITGLLSENPGLKSQLPELYTKAYNQAKQLAEKQTDIAASTFPKQPPWSLDQIMTDGFLPE
ncbi:DUF29 domain-containing protein [Endozoicomonas sp.]|uniref:DUF29 domain-containing protein n=1 Tax=Endozoicomonas sp. TaxID=1892382 RepID=UPI0028865FA3|nr:DUF29 domain-containing protein [Endozoicomonas sp.]